MIGRLLALAAVGAAALVLAASAAAYWSAPGAGMGAGATGGLDQVAGVATSVAGTVASGTFDVSWTPIALPAGVTPTYVVERRQGSKTWTVCTTTAARCTLTGIPDGSSTFRVTAGLNAWTGATSAPTAPLTIETNGPTITAHPPAATTAKAATFSFSLPVFGAFRCRLDGGAQTACTDPQAYSALAVGTHTFEVRAMDAYGSLTQPSTWTWVVNP
jgi:hypothetical protein